jgi:hypothetical protein
MRLSSGFVSGFQDGRCIISRAFTTTDPAGSWDQHNTGSSTRAYSQCATLGGTAVCVGACLPAAIFMLLAEGSLRNSEQ